MARNVMWNTIGSIYYSLCQWLMTVIIVYLTSDYGVVGTLGIAMTVTNSFTTISSFGMRSYQVSDTSHQFKNEEYIMSRRITAIVAFLLCAVYSLTVKDSWSEWFCIIIYMMLRIVESTEDVYQGVLQSNWRFDLIGKSCIMRGSLQIILFVVGFYLTNSLVFAFSLMLLSNLLVFIIYDKRNVRIIANVQKIKWSPRIIELLKNCVGLVVYNFSYNSLATVARVRLKSVLGGSLLGVYSTVASPTVIVQLLAGVAFSPFLPFFSKAYNEKNEKSFRKYIKIILLCYLMGFIVINIAGKLLGKWGLALLYNEEIAAYDELLLPLLWCTFFYACAYLLASVMIAIRCIIPLIIGSIGTYLTNYVLSIVLIKYFGMNGASYSIAVSEVLFGIYLFMFIQFKAKNNFRVD